jgi:DNA polymerase III subunit beta
MEGENSTSAVLNFYIKGIRVTVIARNFDCNVVDYKAVIPAYSTTTVTLNKKNLQQKVEQAMLYANHNFQGVFSINGKVILTANDVDNTKEFKSEFAHQHKEGEDLQIAFNLSFLKKVLANMSSDSVTIEMTTQSRAAIIKEEGVLTLVMPILLAA